MPAYFLYRSNLDWKRRVKKFPNCTFLSWWLFSLFIKTCCQLLSFSCLCHLWSLCRRPSSYVYFGAHFFTIGDWRCCVCLPEYVSSYGMPRCSQPCIEILKYTVLIDVPFYSWLLRYCTYNGMVQSFVQLLCSRDWVFGCIYNYSTSPPPLGST
jgi:hypothetical protein